MKTCFSAKYPNDCLRLSDKIISVESNNFKFQTDLRKLNFKNRGNYFYLELEEFLKNSDNIKGTLKIDQDQFEDFVTKSTNNLHLENHSLLTQVLTNMKLPLLPYQIENVNHCLHYPYFLIGDSMGLGKTPSGLAIASICKKTIVISPAFLKINWQREAEKFTCLSISPILSVRELLKRKISNDLNYDLILVNYEIIDKIESIFEGVELIICDEFHKIANPQSKMAKALFKILMKYKPQRFIGLSGTAINNRVGEFFNPLRLLSLSHSDCGLRLQDDKRINVQFRFNQFFSYEKYNGYGSQFFGLKNYTELKKLLEKKYIRHTIEENLPEMPSIRRIEIDGGEYELELQTKLQECFEGKEIENNENEYLSTIKREAAESKILITLNFIEQLLETEDKVIVFSDHRNPILELSSKTLQFQPVVIIGGMDVNKKQEAIDAFQLGNSRLLLATIGAASTGLTLTASHICVFNDLPWTPAQLLQAEGRVRRIGQKNNCISYIISKSKIDKIILSTLINKAKILNNVLSEGKESLFKVEKKDRVNG